MKSLLLTFKTIRNEDYLLKIDDAKEDATPQEIKSAMEEIISSNVILTSKGKLTTIEKAELVELIETILPLE